MPEPQVSVIIPNYNHSRFLPLRIDAVLQQTFLDFEIIILDDCSQDSSRIIIERYKDHPKISYIVYNRKNSGSPFRQWQKGIALARGLWIWLAESDDYCEPTFLETAMAALNRHQSASLFFCQSNEVDAQNKPIGNMLWLTTNITNYNWDESFCVSGEEFIRKALLQKNIIPNASAVVFRNMPVLSTYLKKVACYKMWGDWLFWSYVIKDHAIVYSPEKLNYFRSHHGTSRSNLSSMKKLRRVSEEVSASNTIKCVFKLHPNSDIPFIRHRSSKYRFIRKLSKIIDPLFVLDIAEKSMKFIKGIY